MRNTIEVAVRAAKAYGADNCGVFSAGITYYTLLSMFPLTLFALSVAGFFFTEPDEQRRLVEDVLDFLPLDAQSGREDLENLITSVVDARGTLGIIGLVGAAYSGSALFGTVRKALNAVVHAEKKRNFALAKGIDILQVLIFTVLILLSIGVTAGIALLQTFSEDVFGAEAETVTRWLLGVAWALVPTAVSTGVFFLLFTFVPARRLGARNTVWGALVAAVLFEVLKLGFTQYVTHFGNYNATYGTLGFVIVLLVFINFSAQIMLFGAEVARARAEVSEDDVWPTRETDAISSKLSRLLGRLPFAGGLGERAPRPEPVVSGDLIAAAPLVAVTRPEPAAVLRSGGPAAVAMSGAVRQPARRGGEDDRAGPGAFVALLLFALAGLVYSLRRR
jgi:membrane protein